MLSWSRKRKIRPWDEQEESGQSEIVSVPKARQSSLNQRERNMDFLSSEISDPGDYNIDIVAVHGLAGDWEETWTDENGKLWLRDFLPAQLSNARIMSYGYNSNTAFSKAITDINDEAAMLLDRVDGERQLKEEKTGPILFISHSLGGIVVKKALILAHERSQVYGGLLDCVRGSVFFGVPHRGADAAYWASFAATILKVMQIGFGTNTNFVDALRRNSGTFADISQQFIERAARLQIRTFYETEKLYNQLVVDKDSARLGIANEIAVGVAGANHKTMCKFDNADSQKYLPVMRAIKKLADSAVVDSSSSPVSLSTDEIKCLQCLYITDYMSHRKRNPDRVAGTCEWFLCHEKYHRWRQDPESSLLWVSADPGCGKSVLASFLVGELNSRESQATLPGTVCFFFFKDDNDAQKSATSSLCALLHQLFTAKKALIRHAVRDFGNKAQKFTEELGTLWSIFTTTVADEQCGNIICIIDGLDECEESTRSPLIDKLVEFYSDCENHQNYLKFIVTSRPYPSIERRFHKLPTTRLKAEDEASATSSDIELVVRARVKDIGSMRSLSQTVQDDLEKYLVRNADRTFLWVSLILEMIEKSAKVPRKALDDIISTIPSTLDAVYEKILQQSSNVEDARKLLHIVVAAMRPLTLKEMNVAFSVKPGDRSDEDLDLEPSIGDTIRDLCGLFLRVVDSKIYLVHLTAKEFLISSSDNANSSLEPWKHSLWPIESNRVLAEICISYLLFVVFERYPLVLEGDRNINKEKVDQYTEGHDFLDYAAKHWADHFRDAKVTEETVLLKSALDICDTRSKRFLTWFQVYWTTVTFYGRCPQGFTDLMVGSYFGHEAVARLLVDRGADVNARDDYGGGTALRWAAWSGHEALARLLVDRGADVNARDDNGGTVLRWAAERGHEAVAQLLTPLTSDS